MSSLNVPCQTKIVSLLFASILLISSCPGAFGQEKPFVAPVAKQILLAAVETARKMKSIAYEARFENVSGLSTKGSVEMERDVLLDEALPAKVRVRVEGSAGAQEVSFDGKIARRLVHNKKLLTEGTVEKRGLEVARNSPAMTLLLWDLLWAEPFKFERAATSMEYVGRAAIEGVVCHVIDIQYTIPGTDIQQVRWWFGIEDKLPRRFQKIHHSTEGKTMSELTVSNLRIGDGISPSSYAIALPEGYSFQRFAPGASPQPIAVGQAAPDWTIRDIAGKEHRLSDYRGEVVVLSFWASWCGYCKLAMPEIQKIHEKYRGRGVKVLTVNIQEEKDTDAIAYLKTLSADFPVLLKGESAADAYKVKSVPGFYVIDQAGKVAFAKLLYSPKVSSEIEAVVEASLSKAKS